jgi:WD40 repeat protein
MIGCKKKLCCVLFCLLPCTGFAQSADASSCNSAAPGFATSAPNIFNDRQEQDLGDALAEYVESDMRIAPPQADDELTRIGQGLLAALPKTGVVYRFRVYDSGEINAFSLAGGRVYVSRKLLAAIRNEDELAGVLAHEIGHLSTHQTAIEMTRSLRLRLGVTQAGDRADIFAKVHQFMRTQAKKSEEEDTEKKDQLAADRVALFAVARAGYSPESFAQFLDRSTINRGKTGSWLSDAFGITSENAQRYRNAVKLIAALPPGCKGRSSAQPEAFQAWLREMVRERLQTVAAGVDGDRPVKLDPPLHPSLWRIRFSPNGRYLLAQDDGSIHIIDRQEEKTLFRIDAPNSQKAQFTPDSESVIFHDEKLRVERWNVTSGKRTDVKELVVYDGCNQTLLSQDGKTLVCTNFNFKNDLPRVSLRMVDVDSGNIFLDKPDFYRLNALSSTDSVFQLAFAGLLGEDIATMLASPDGRYLLASVANVAFAYDLKHRQPVELGGKLKNLVQGRMSFVGPDALYVTGEQKGNLVQAQIVSFPDGRLLKETRIGLQRIEEATENPLLLLSPMKDYAIGAYDPMQEKLLAASKLPSMDVWKQIFAVEGPSGGVQTQQQSNDVTNFPLPLGPLPKPRAASFSPDGKYLAVSLRNRGQIWNIETGKSVLLSRPFRSAWIDSADRLFAQFPKYIDQDVQERVLDLNTQAGKGLGQFEAEDFQFQNLQLRFKPMGKGKDTSRHATLEVKNMETQTVSWTRDYPHETPAIWPADDDRMVLAWDLASDTAKDDIKRSLSLQRQMKALTGPKKGLLLELVAPETGAPLLQVILPEANLSRNDHRDAKVSGDFALARNEGDNTTIYRLSDGARIGEFVGDSLATDASGGIVAALHREDEIVVIDEHTGKELRRITLGSRVLAGHIVGSKERELLVLTADQVVHRLPLSQSN